MFDVKFPSVEFQLASEVYHKIDAMSSSRVKILDNATPMHLSYSLANPKDSDDFVVGRATHSYILERYKFTKEFAVQPALDGRTKEGKAGKEKFKLENEGKSILTEEQFALVQGMADGIMVNPDAYHFCTTAGESEVSVFGELHGVKTKARFDRLIKFNNGEDCIVDLKTTRGIASRSDFERSMWQFGYGVQANLYLQMARGAGLNPKHFVFVVVEKNAPHAAAVYRVSDRIIEMFDAKVLSLVAKYREFLLNGSAGFQGITEIGIPAWAVNQLTNELENSHEV